jgi:putative FmdB family regulatory protein
VPTYEFTCLQCDKTLTITAGFEKIDGATCPDCHELLKRSYTFGAVTFKGSGFYRNDRGT